MPTEKGFKHTPQTIETMKAAQKKRWSGYTEEKRTKIIAALKAAHKHTPCPEKKKKMLREKYSGSNAFAWKGGKHMHSGYVQVYAPDHPSSNKKGYIFEHRLVMSEMLGRPLDKYDVVHHKNRIKSDNRPENLEHLRGDNLGARYPVICPNCGHAF